MLEKMYIMCGVLYFIFKIYETNFIVRLGDMSRHTMLPEPIFPTDKEVTYSLQCIDVNFILQSLILETKYVHGRPQGKAGDSARPQPPSGKLLQYWLNMIFKTSA